MTSRDGRTRHACGIRIKPTVSSDSLEIDRFTLSETSKKPNLLRHCVQILPHEPSHQPQSRYCRKSQEFSGGGNLVDSLAVAVILGACP